MPHYRASRWFNTRARCLIEFEAANDDAARHRVNMFSDEEWRCGEFDFYNEDADDDINADALLDLDKIEGGALPVVENISDGQRVQAAMPYSWDAIQLVRDIVKQSESDEPMSGADFMQAMFDRARAIVGKE